MRETANKPDIVSSGDSFSPEKLDGDDALASRATDHRPLNEGGETKFSLLKEDRDINLLTCRNERYEGQCHPETGIPYVRKTIEYNGETYEGVFPEFESAFDTTLPEDKFKATDREHIAICNAQLKEALEKNPDLKEQFTEEQLEQIENGDTPDGYTWHHNEEPGKMQLISTISHDGTRHTGGRVIWGGGRESRA